MFKFARSVLIFSGLAGVSLAQSFAPAKGPLSADNTEMFNRAEPEQFGTGTISVQELLHPLEGKARQTIAKASGSIASGNSAQAMEQLRSAMRDSEAQPYALSMLGAEHLKRGDVDTAIVELQDAIMLMPGLAANHSNLAFALGIKQRNEEALREARKALQLDPGSARYRYVIGQIFLQMGRREEAAFHLKRAADKVPGARALLMKYFGQ